MKPLFILIFLFIVNLSEAQIADRILFEYDSAGNQILRALCLNCNESRTGNDYKNFDDVTPDELFKFYPEDIISYYPNPVREELYLKWNLIDGNTVNEIKMFDINAKLILKISDLNNSDATTIQFSFLPKNIYLIVIAFKNGESKTIKILKE